MPTTPGKKMAGIMMDDDLYIHVKYAVRGTNINPALQDPDDFVSTITGDIILWNDLEDEDDLTIEQTEEFVTIGQCKFIYLDFDEAKRLANISPWDVMDVNQSIMDIAGALYDEDGKEWSPFQQTANVTEALGVCRDDLEYYSRNLFIIDMIKLLPAYRGKGISQEVINDAIRRFSGTAIMTALKAFPLQCTDGGSRSHSAADDKFQLSNFSPDFKKGVKALKKHYSQMGFVAPYPSNKQNNNIMVKLARTF